MSMENRKIKLEYWNGAEWVFVSDWYSEAFAWLSLGCDNYNYRTVDENGKVLNTSDNFDKPFDLSQLSKTTEPK